MSMKGDGGWDGGMDVLRALLHSNEKKDTFHPTYDCQQPKEDTETG